MRPKERRDSGQADLLRSRLDAIIDMNHALVKLSRTIDWSFLAERFGAVYEDKPGRPPLPTRLMAGLAILKHTYDLSDEVLCERWVENPYYQFFCGEEFFQHRLVFDRSSLTRWRQRMGEEKLQALLQESLSVATKTKAIKPSDLNRVIVDTTVQPKNVMFPTDARLLNRAREILVRLAKEQLTLIRIFEELRGRGYDGGYDAVRRYARRWSKERGQSTAAAYVPLSFAPGEAYQFDWSHEVVLLSGTTVMVKAAHVRLCHSRMLFVRAYPRETQEMVFDAHDRAFALFKGTCTRGIYDNMKTAVETIFVGKGRLYNRRFLQMCSHYLVDPVACTPASGWEKGQVENQVGLVRERFFTPRLRFKTLDELNAWLLDKCIAYAKAHRHPELVDQTIWDVFEAERPKLVPYAGRFDGFHAVTASVSKTCLVRFDNNKYSVAANAVGRPVEVQAYADRIVIRQDGRIVAEHPRSFGRGDTVYDPWHYVPVLARKPGALRNGAPFKDWVLPAAIERIRRKLASTDDGNRQMVDILNAVLTDGLPAVEAACAEALSHSVHSADVVLNILARQREPAPPANIMTPAALTLRHAPIADCARYDNLRRTI
ncbi:transposase [Bradyrhizobium sp. USDA 3256]